MSHDLGTFHFRVEFTDGRGFVQSWGTGARFSHGRGDTTCLTANLIPPTYENPEEVIRNAVYMFTEGNYACDCNRAMSLDDAEQVKRRDDYPCGDTIKLASIKALYPNEREWRSVLEAH